MVVRAVNWYRFECNFENCDNQTVPVYGTKTGPEAARREAAHNAEKTCRGWSIRSLGNDALCPEHSGLLDDPVGG